MTNEQIENELEHLADGLEHVATELEHLKASIHKDFGDVSPADNGSSGFAGC